MITLTAKIDISSGIREPLENIVTESQKADFASNINTVKSTVKQAKSPFIIGSNLLGDGSTFIEKVDYFIGAQLSDANGNFKTAYEFKIDSKAGVNALVFVFDTENNRHPIKVTVDGKEYANDDAIVVANVISATTHTLYIDNWNTPNSPLVITGIYADLAIKIDRSNILSIDRTIYDRSDLKMPSFGIISNAGSIEFNDVNREVRNYAEMGFLEKGLPCTISLNNTFVQGATQTIGVFETDEWDYDDENKTVSVSLKDDLEEWQEINIEGINYDPRNTEEKPFSWLYEYLHSITIKDGRYSMYMFDSLSDETRYILSGTFIKYPMLNPCTLWQAWQKLCYVCQLHIFKNRQGIIECVYNGGN